MNEQEALSKSTMFIKSGMFLGYFPFNAANYLVGTGKYQFEQSTPWGYTLSIVQKKEAGDGQIKGRI